MRCPPMPERGVAGTPGAHGRARSELDLVALDLRTACLVTAGAQLVTIYGDPGIGKSRLTRELLAWADAQAGEA